MFYNVFIHWLTEKYVVKLFYKLLSFNEVIKWRCNSNSNKPEFGNSIHFDSQILVLGIALTIQPPNHISSHISFARCFTVSSHLHFKHLNDLFADGVLMRIHSVPLNSGGCGSTGSNASVEVIPATSWLWLPAENELKQLSSWFEKGKVAWFMILAFWMNVPRLTGQPIWMFFGQRAEDCGYPPAHHWRRFLSTRVHQVQRCCHILQLSHWSVLIHWRSDSWYLCNLCVHIFKWLLACLLLSSLPLYKEMPALNRW